MAPAGRGMAGKAILNVRIPDKEALYEAYMPFVHGGGLFIATRREYRLGEEVFVLLQLLDERERLPFAGRVVWITPPGAAGNRVAGIGVQIAEDASGRAVRSKIESYLGGALKGDRRTLTL
ncbi:MAG: pilus assembly protein PilZ [Gammaproteobacteria bacterium]|nr:MAG: pilus assembly protein PilZ [Gammaproteobacteria bacterium]